MRQHPVIIILLSFTLMMSSCAQSAKERNAAIVAEWVGKQLVIPDSLIYTIAGDTINYDPLDADFTIIAYISSDGCTTCNMHLQEWQKTITSLASTTLETINFLMVLQSDELHEFTHYIQEEEFLYPIAFDNHNLFVNANPMLRDLKTGVFLLTPDGSVSIIGNPCINPKIYNLYENKLISSSSTEHNVAKYDDVAIVPAGKSLGIVDYGKEYNSWFSVNNNSTDTLEILDIVPSCGCTTITINDRTIAPNSRIRFKATYQPEEKYGLNNIQINVFFKELQYPLLTNLYVYKKSRSTTSYSLKTL